MKLLEKKKIFIIRKLTKIWTITNCLENAVNSSVRLESHDEIRVIRSKNKLTETFNSYFVSSITEIIWTITVKKWKNENSNICHVMNEWVANVKSFDNKFNSHEIQNPTIIKSL